MYPPLGNNRLGNTLSALAIATILVFATTGQYAFGDNVQNDVVAGGNDTITTSSSTTINYRIRANNGDGQNGCNAADSSAALVTINKPASVTASPGSLTFTSCDTNKPVIFSSSTVGDYIITVTVSDSGVGSYNLNPATFTLHVTAPPNTDPIITVPDNQDVEGNTAGGANVDYSLLAGDLSASDSEDGNLSSEIDCAPNSGSFFALGGPHGIVCTVEDSAGASDSGTFEITIVDATDPQITVPDNLAQEATDANGAVVIFTVTTSDIVDEEADISCKDQDGNTVISGNTFPLGTTTVTCTATDDSGNDASDSFEIVIQDTTAPDLTVPFDITEEATGPSGAIVSFTASATDAVDGDVPVDCTPTSGTVFSLGSTPVSCSASDTAGNTAAGGFNIIVQDTTSPVLSLPADIIEEATGPAGAVVTFSASASDLVDGSVSVICNPASGSTFALGSTVVSCETEDNAGNSAAGTFSVTVQDTTPPALTLPSDITEEATGSIGAVATFSATATDLVDGPVSVVCNPESGSIFALGTATVECSSTDAAGNIAIGSFTVTVQDTTPPTLTLPGDMTVEATGPAGATASFAATASDIVDGSTIVECIPSSGSTFPLGATTVLCSSTDDAGNSASGSFLVTVVDTTPPTLYLPASITASASGIAGAVVAYSATATDLVDGPVAVDCTPATGSTFPIGATAVNCDAQDSAGNVAAGSFTVTVTVQTTGFYQPVDMNSFVNVVKAGSTVPLKFEVFGDRTVPSTEISDGSVVKTLKQKLTSCDPSAPTDEVETTATGGTLLRYDSTAGQFIYNWKTPLQKGCYTVTMTLLDDSTIQALFRLK